MIPSLMADAASRPELFVWNGPIDGEKLADWLQDRRWSVPGDLAALWRETGGGELFESVQILGPFGRRDFGDDVESVNARYHAEGLPPDLLVFSDTDGISAVQMAAGQIVVVDGANHQVLARFANLEDWYVRHIRAEYAARYGLT
jgi:hypothetical protein